MLAVSDPGWNARVMETGKRRLCHQGMHSLKEKTQRNQTIVSDIVEIVKNTMGTWGGRAKVWSWELGWVSQRRWGWRGVVKVKYEYTRDKRPIGEWGWVGVRRFPEEETPYAKAWYIRRHGISKVWYVFCSGVWLLSSKAQMANAINPEGLLAPACYGI